MCRVVRGFFGSLWWSVMEVGIDGALLSAVRWNRDLFDYNNGISRATASLEQRHPYLFDDGIHHLFSTY